MSTVVGMAEPGRSASLDARMNDAQRKSLELEQERLHLHDRVLETAESIRRSHERTAQTLEMLADTGAAEHAARRRRAAEQSRRLAESEASEIAELKGLGSPERNRGCGDRGMI